MTEPQDNFFETLKLQHQQNIQRHKYENLVTFFSKYNCPDISFAVINNYLYAADKNNLDYRLLPSISIQESSCFKHYRLQNGWGWNSARTGFESVPAGIDYVSRQLAEGKYYKGKSIKDILHSYNPEPSYAGKIIRLMGEIE
jgi:hypothetical protein